MGLFSKLINGDTRLKSLRFGADNSFDKPGGGYSNQPYIIKNSNLMANIVLVFQMTILF